MSGPCAKQTVACHLFSKDGRIVVGTNACNNPQPDCPRAPGEGYEKCKSVCHQQGHAEEQAVAAARAEGVDLTGAYALITGHTYVCQNCQHTLFGAGVRWIGVNPSPSPNPS